MTYRRDADTWAGRLTAAVSVIGDAAAVEAAGVTASRLRQLANPMRTDLAAFEVALRLDVACARAGGGTPVFDLFRERLASAGAIDAAPAWPVVIRTAVGALRAIADRLDALIRPAWQPALMGGAMR